MVRQRRFERYLGFIFLAAGALLLFYTATIWFSSWQSAAVIGRPPKVKSYGDLPPALAPILERSAQPETAVANRLAEHEIEAPEPAANDGAALLPQSPPAAGDGVAVRLPIESKTAAVAAQPQRILIPALGIDAPVQPVGLGSFSSNKRDYLQWTAPDSYAAGWHDNGALPGQGGNTVLNGHNNVHGAIFADLAHLAVGEQIMLWSESGIRVYRVAHHELLEERGASLRERLRNARWIEPTADERLTLVTCWPNTTNSHRLIVVAKPVGESDG